LRRFPQRFTKNKDAVRNLQRETIVKYAPPAKLGGLRYFGLPSSALCDVEEWQDLFGEFVAVERGEDGREWELQHDLELKAFQTGLSGRITQFRGDIDLIIEKRKDLYGNRLRFPFDVVTLDYSGGLFYRDPRGRMRRLAAIASLIRSQAEKRATFVLLISCNLDQVDQGEVQRTLGNTKTELTRYGVAAEEVVDAYLKHDRDEVRLKIYLPYFINQEAAKYHFNCETEKVIFYEGNLKTRMMAFRFHLSFDEGTQCLRSPRERLSQIFNKPFIIVVDGVPSETSLGLPKLTALNEAKEGK
jgi:hypothetical protein